MLALIGLFLLLSPNMHAQDPMKVGPKVYKKVLLENDKVRVMSVEFAPGQAMPMHSHPQHTVYVLAGGTIEITEKGKPSTVSILKAGDAIYFPAVTHMGKNTGKTTIKLVVSEIKPAMKK
ncbi:MAG: cupin domain-containing protein [Bacteroidota bacterium]